MASELREKTILGMIWNTMERFGSSFFLFTANLILARLLSPDDFGAIAMLMVFISLSEVIIDAGLSNALIQRQGANHRDSSTIFVWNICFAGLLYMLLFLTAPFVAKFYQIDILKDMLRIQGLIIPLNSLVLVHIALLKKQLKFKMLAKINLLAIIVGSIVGIISAFYGAGVWSLVIKLLLTSVIQVFCFYGIKFWIPTLTFDYYRFKSMFRFGGFIFLTRIVNTIYHNTLALIVGKSFDSATLGFYNQARKMEDIPRSSLSSVVNNVTFPIFSQINDDLPRLRKAVSRCMRHLSFIAIPLMFVAIVVAKPVFIVLLTTKWIQSVSYFQFLCLGGLVLTPIEVNTQLLNSIGKSSISFYIRMFQRSVGICLFFVGIKFGMEGLLIAYVVSQYLSFVVAGFFSGRYIGYGLVSQFKDLAPFALASIVSACIALIPLQTTAMISDIWLLLTQIILFVVVYYGISKLFKFEEMNTYFENIKIRIKR